jgi:antitoxin (DNA-binding transcriptional repressor) of toxin-antitoxin stability system
MALAKPCSLHTTSPVGASRRFDLHLQHPSAGLIVRGIGTSEAENNSADLLDLVEQSEEIMITRHDKEVARLVAPRPVRNRDQARAALQRMRERAEQQKFGRLDWDEWKSYRTKVAREFGARQLRALGLVPSSGQGIRRPDADCAPATADYPGRSALVLPTAQ